MPKKSIVRFLAMAAVAVSLTLLFTYSLGRRTREESAQPCWGKLARIEGAKQQFAQETGATSGAVVSVEAITPYLRSMPTCHIAGAMYIVGRVNEEPKCTVHGTTSNFKPDRY